jgi:hypothetical protein
MSTTVTKYPFFFSFEKEEKWLKEMSAQGWHLIKAPGFGYTFVQGQPEQRTYKIDFRYFKRKVDQEEYLSLFEDSGWNYVKPSKNQSNYYFYTVQADASKDIFSDKTSKAQRNLRAAQYSTYIMLAVLLPNVVLYLTGTRNLRQLGYLTPGLWEMQGVEFIQHFLFETPFVFLRVTAALVPVFIFLITLFFYLRSYQSYKKLVKPL